MGFYVIQTKQYIVVNKNDQKKRKYKNIMHQYSMFLFQYFAKVLFTLIALGLHLKNKIVPEIHDSRFPWISFRGIGLKRAENKHALLVIISFIKSFKVFSPSWIKKVLCICLLDKVLNKNTFKVYSCKVTKCDKSLKAVVIFCGIAIIGLFIARPNIKSNLRGVN